MESIIYEDVSHIMDNITIPESNGKAHYSQTGAPIKVKILFAVTPFDDEENEYQFKIVSVRVPRGLPVYRVRSVIREMEEQLRTIYKTVIRLNFVSSCPDHKEEWSIVSQLPTYRVMYV